MAPQISGCSVRCYVSEEGADSDIDLLIEMAEDRGFSDYLGFVEELDGLLARRVDLVIASAEASPASRRPSSNARAMTKEPTLSTTWKKVTARLPSSASARTLLPGRPGSSASVKSMRACRSFGSPTTIAPINLVRRLLAEGAGQESRHRGLRGRRRERRSFLV